MAVVLLQYLTKRITEHVLISVATIINRVTEREEAVYECGLETVMNNWRYRIRVIVIVNVYIGENYKEEFNFKF